MGKGSEQSNKAEATAKVESRFYKWEEIKKHNKIDDCWIVLNESVYDVSKFMKKHPGGEEVINLYAGQYATEAYNAFHTDFDKAEKYKKLYLIGRVDPDEALALRQSDPKIQRRDQLRKYFEELRQLAIEKGFFKTDALFYITYFIQTLACHLGGYYVLWHYGTSLWGFVASFVLLLLGQVQLGWHNHDYSHSSVVSVKFDRGMHYVVMSFLKGLGSQWWMDTHKIHHGKTNLVEIDPDFSFTIFCYSAEQARKRAERNFKGEERLYFPYNYQHIVFFFASFLVMPLHYYTDSLRIAWDKRNFIDLFGMLTYYSYHLAICYAVFDSIWLSMAHLFVLKMVESGWLIWPIVSPHLPMQPHDLDQAETWVDQHLVATSNYNSSAFVDWYSGHMNFQIEHHLFPKMQRHNLHKVQPYVKELCAKYNIKYTSKPMLTAFLDLLKVAQTNGAIWKETYNKLKAEKNK